MSQIEQTFGGSPLIEPGRIIGKCRVEGKLGEGAMGAVYRARHLTLDVPVALKVLHPDVAADDPAFARYFIREARLAAKVRHPNVVAVMDTDRDAATGLYFIVYEYIQGGTLSDRLDQGLPAVPEALDLLAGTAQGLAAAAAINIVHRDIKPDNILLAEDGRPMLADLGFARAFTGGADSIEESVIVGTYAYMSPEQVHAPATVDARSDIYSLGATFYRMLTGRRLFEVEDEIDLHDLRRLVDRPTPDPREHRTSLPEEVADLCGRMLRKNREERIQTATEVAARAEALRMSFGDADTASFDVLTRLPRALLTPAGGDDARRIFLLPRKTLGFGKEANNPAVALPLRLAPGPGDDADACLARSRKISRHHGNFIHADGRFYVESLSANGIYNHVAGADGAAGDDGQTMEDVTDLRTIEMQRIHRGMRFPIDGRLHLSLGHDLLHFCVDSVTPAEGRPGALVVERVGNLAGYTYIQLVERVEIGFAPWVSFSDLSEATAVLAFRPDRGGYRVEGVRGDSLAIDGEAVPDGSSRLLRGESCLCIGGREWLFRHARDEDFLA